MKQSRRLPITSNEGAINLLFKAKWPSREGQKPVICQWDLWCSFCISYWLSRFVLVSQIFGTKGWLSVDRSARLLSNLQDPVPMLSRLQRIYAAHKASLIRVTWEPDKGTQEPTMIRSVSRSLDLISLNGSCVPSFQQGFRLRGVQPLSLTWQLLSTGRSANWINHSCHPTVPLVLSWITVRTNTSVG